MEVDAGGESGVDDTVGVVEAGRDGAVGEEHRESKPKLCKTQYWKNCRCSTYKKTNTFKSCAKCSQSNKEEKASPLTWARFLVTFVFVETSIKFSSSCTSIGFKILFSILIGNVNLLEPLY